MMADKGSILDTLALEEPGIDPEELGGSAPRSRIYFVFFRLARHSPSFHFPSGAAQLQPTSASQ